MRIDAAPFDPTPPLPRAPRLSRRSVLAGLGFGGAALTILKTGESVGAIAGQLNGPGEALATATRITTTTTTTTTVPTTAACDPGEPGTYDTSLTEVPITAAEGKIPFPIVVGEDDYCYVLKNFGACRDGCNRSHEGVDIMADRGLPVIAVADGVLTKIYEVEDECRRGGAGNGWTLTDEQNDVVYKFFHLDAHAEGLEVGDTVIAGQVIGYIGETGTTGANSSQENFHLHFEYRPFDDDRDSYVALDSFDLLDRPEHVRFAS
jgi:murein DD-endopeptidase MepM/ murein hydrolase activator NlpD